ncbi:MAG TPA: hypothetical protein VFH59_17490 [Frateuria sp.]|uniref:hypothetical protein n=1 Tax=Frateuria sp. TaxID=2211372 RepID=UPI002D80E133|nr:hypothetical protein [Frateuria sp.]HET6807233.1 hypothetical protein [Frateuria sp.]
MSRIAEAIIRCVTRRPPDFLVGGQDNPYLKRWWVIPRNPLFNIYLHQFLRDDDDRALHDHPWPWCSIVLRGEYTEVTHPACEVDSRDGFVNVTSSVHRDALLTASYEHDRGDVLLIARRTFGAGSIRFHLPWFAHRLELTTDCPCWTLFITGPRLREWGFHCPRGWVPWQRFTAADDKGAIGPGCGEG